MRFLFLNIAAELLHIRAVILMQYCSGISQERAPFGLHVVHV